MSAYGMPPAEREITADQALVELARHRPELAAASIRPLGEGWDNHAFRVRGLGEDLVLRFPRRRVALDFMRAELRWLPELAPRLSLPTSEPLIEGVWDGWPWSASRFIAGSSALGVELDQEVVSAQLLQLFSELHRPAPPEAPKSRFRSEPLSAKADRVRELCSDPRVLEVFEQAQALPGFRGPRRWIHGDLHPLNVVIAGGRLAGIIDWGDVTAGDPAVDYSFLWMVLDAEHRERLRGGVDPRIWGRARGWAVFFGCVYAGTELEETGAAMLRSLLDEP
jgi:aminoglycoside phosphotransferase (APT) family kinase protein